MLDNQQNKLNSRHAYMQWPARLRIRVPTLAATFLKLNPRSTSTNQLDATLCPLYGGESWGCGVSATLRRTMGMWVAVVVDMELVRIAIVLVHFKDYINVTTDYSDISLKLITVFMYFRFVLKSIFLKPKILSCSLLHPIGPNLINKDDYERSRHVSCARKPCWELDRF